MQACTSSQGLSPSRAPSKGNSLKGPLWGLTVTGFFGTVAGLGGHIFGMLAGAIYCQARGTHFWLVGRRNQWPFSGNAFFEAWLAQPMASLVGHIFAAWPPHPMACLGGHMFGGLAGATYCRSQGTIMAAWLAQPTVTKSPHNSASKIVTFCIVGTFK